MEASCLRLLGDGRYGSRNEILKEPGQWCMIRTKKRKIVSNESFH